MIKKISYIFAIIFVVLLSSCDRNRVFEEYVEIENNIWSQDNKINFEFEIDDTASLHNVLINVRHASVYPYSNLWMFVESSAPNGTINIDSVECVLVDADNRWLGDGLGDIWDIQIPWKSNVRFSHKGVYRVQFEQAMRVKDLPGIMDIGLRVEKVESNK